MARKREEHVFCCWNCDEEFKAEYTTGKPVQCFRCLVRYNVSEGSHGPYASSLYVPSLPMKAVELADDLIFTGLLLVLTGTWSVCAALKRRLAGVRP